MFFFNGEVIGKIASEPKGNRDFQWDCVFIPDGEEKTFSELGEKKNDISMRKIAFDAFNKHLEEGN
jgi:XTP/dITP diphosphohydrolase